LEKINNDNQIYLDLRGTPCPLNFIRCSLALERLQKKESMQVDIDKGEPEETIIYGLSQAGHKVSIVKEDLEFITLLINPFES
tara:strand:- start:513 stop:761 length:249 start_codon:yes stop_codon:yes gene_type:complete